MDASVPFELFIALRYLLARRQQSSISRVSLFSTIGVAVGVMALVVALALMTGLQGELRNRILGSQAHIYVWKTGSLGDYESEVARLRETSRCGRCWSGHHRQGHRLVRSGRRVHHAQRCGPCTRRPGDGHRADDDQGQPVRSRDTGRRRSTGHSARPRSRAATRCRGGRRDHAHHAGWIALADGTHAAQSPRACRRCISTRTLRVRLGVRLRQSRFRQAVVHEGSARSHSTARQRHLGCGRDRQDDPGASRPRVRQRRLVRAQSFSLLGALAGEDGDLDHHRSHRHGRCASTSSRRSFFSSCRRAATSRS